MNGHAKDTPMTNYPYILFNQSPEQLRRIGARGGHTQARNRRLRLLAQAQTAPPIPKEPEPDEETPAQAIAALDAQSPWFGKPGENSTIWDSPSPKFIMSGSDEDKFDHPTQKPVALMRRPILNHSQWGEMVYDPFLGSGTTLVAAELTERTCCGLELDPKYVDVIVERWQELTGKQATLNGETFQEVRSSRSAERGQQ
jgi:DNA modification methylase